MAAYNINIIIIIMRQGMRRLRSPPRGRSPFIASLDTVRPGSTAILWNLRHWTTVGGRCTLLVFPFLPFRLAVLVFTVDDCDVTALENERGYRSGKEFFGNLLSVKRMGL